MRWLAPFLVGVLLFGTLLTSCGGDDGPSATRDTAGPLLTLVEELRIDGYQHDLVPIDTTIRVAVAEDGRIAIAQRQTYNVRLFSPSGEPLGSIGRQGQGPGEFEAVHRLGWIADTLYAYDFTLRRFTLMDPEFNYVRYVHVPPGARPSPEFADNLPSFSTVFGGALYADGSVYGELAGPNPREIGTYELGKSTYGRIREDGTVLSYFQFATGPAIDPVTVSMTMPDGTSTTGMLMPIIMPMPERPILRLADNGTRMAHLQVFMEGPDAGTFELFVEDVFDGPLYRRRYPFDAVPITRSVQDSILAARFEDSPEDDPIATALRANAVFPPMLPPVVGMVHGADDRLWIRLADTQEGRPYDILDPGGEPIGRVVLPITERIAVADATHIWVIERDDLGIESVIRYAVEWGEM